MPAPRVIAGALSALAAWCARHPHPILAAWLALTIAAALFSADLPRTLKGGVGNVPGTGSWRVEQALARDFDLPFAQLLLVVLEGEGWGPAQREADVESLAQRLRAEPGVGRAVSWPTRAHEPAVLAVGLDVSSLDEAERLVTPLRAAVAGYTEDKSGLTALVTGQAAFGVDLNDYAARASAQAEQRVLPLTLLALLLAFGALGASLAPLVCGAAAVIAAMGLLRVVAAFMPLSVYSSSIASMLGLGLGIDYALFVVSRIREEGGDVPRAVRHAAPFIALSAGTVVIGLAVMATVPVQDLIGLGVGGALVALTSAGAGITLLPALAGWLGPWLEAPRLLSARLAGGERAARWERRAGWVVAHRRAALVGASALLVVLSAPLARIDLGFPEVGQLPAEIETMRGWAMLARMETAGALTPVNLLIEAPPGERLLTPARVLGLADLAGSLRSDPLVGEVRALADHRRGARHLATALALGLGPDLGDEGRQLLSRDGTATLVQVVLRSEATGREKDAFDAALRRRDWNAHRGLAGAGVHLGGLTALNRDLEVTAVDALPRVAALVVAATVVMLFLMTRSYLIPLKAVAANLLTTTAALGGTLALFRSDWGARLLGLDAPMLNVTPGMPILVFCIVFGLSMDYEVFLIARIREAHLQGDPDDRAVVRGLGASGSVITSAAVIMAIVFGGFALTDLIVVKMLGVALALGVLLDATVVRLLLVPALMVVLGRWNWYPRG